MRMPGGGGLAAMRRLRDAAPLARVLVLTASDKPASLIEAVEAGATGYLTKRVKGEELRAAVLAVSRGESVVEPGLAGHLMRELASGQDGPSARVTLTVREREILRLVCDGLTDGEVGSRLFVSMRTVQNDLRRIRDKTGLERRSELVRWAATRSLAYGIGAHPARRGFRADIRNENQSPGGRRLPALPERRVRRARGRQRAGRGGPGHRRRGGGRACGRDAARRGAAGHDDAGLRRRGGHPPGARERARHTGAGHLGQRADRHDDGGLRGRRVGLRDEVRPPAGAARGRDRGARRRSGGVPGTGPDRAPARFPTGPGRTMSRACPPC